MLLEAKIGPYGGLTARGTTTTAVQKLVENGATAEMGVKSGCYSRALQGFEG